MNNPICQCTQEVITISEIYKSKRGSETVLRYDVIATCEDCEASIILVSKTSEHWNRDILQQCRLEDEFYYDIY